MIIIIEGIICSDNYPRIKNSDDSLKINCETILKGNDDLDLG